MPRDKREVESGLLSKGFKLGSGDHNYYIYYGLDGKKTMARTKTSHGSSKTLGDELIARMSRQCHLSKIEFLSLIDCPLSRERYEDLLVERGVYERDK